MQPASADPIAGTEKFVNDHLVKDRRSRHEIVMKYGLFPLVLGAVMLLLHSFRVRAEGGCPPGQYPQEGQGWKTCVPIPDNDHGGRPAMPVRWQEQWQAIATDTPKGIMGTSVNQATADDSVRAAISDCHAKGGTDCQIEISYGNGCVALVFGSALKNSRSASTKEEAERRAMQKCSEEDANCHVFYSACSLPKRI
jgi:Domain of unknown function (DUF4189)